MSKPLAAIVGRPNVGKSTLFNRIAGGRISIVEDTPGVTRDRIYADAEWGGKEFLIVDTGGLETAPEDAMRRQVRAQAEIAVDTADVIIFVVDGRTGLMPEDLDAAAMLRRADKPVVLAVNKLDNFEKEPLYEFYNLGLGDPVGVSAEHGKGTGDLLDRVVEGFPENSGEDGDALKIAVVGKPNAGKSSLVNRLLGYERVIVTDTPGATRDAVDTRFSADGRNYVLIDTAGMRRKRNIDESVEQYGVMRSLAAVRRADVCVVVLDASMEVSEQDVRICGYVHEQGKPSVIAVNKWDLIDKDGGTMNEYVKRLEEKLKFMDYFMPAFVSAKTGKRADSLLELAETAHANSSRRITTGLLNEVIREAVLQNEPASPGGRRLKILYATQASANPPVFVIFVNDAKLMHFSYERYLENAVRRAFDFKGTPVRLVIRSRKDKDAGNPAGGKNR